MDNLGHEILTWDEEALVHLPDDTYYSRRLSPTAIRYNSYLFAWGEDNAELWRRYPDLPSDLPIHVTGNPRSDMLRPDLRSYYEPEAHQLEKDYGDFILINTNFNHVNAFFPAQNLFRPVKRAGEESQFGKAAVGMSREYAERLRDHKEHIFNAFKEVIPALDKAFPDHKIIVRPHPTENQGIYKDIARGCRNVNVTNEGNVVPWLMAAKAVIHNGCTTGVEAFVMEVPAISYRPTIDEEIDMGFYRLPNLISHQCFDFNELQEILGKILNGELGAANGDERQELARKHLTAHDGPLACERIIDVIDARIIKQPDLPRPPMNRKVLGWIQANWRRFNRYIRKYLPGKHAPEEFHRHRYPGITLQELNTRIARLQQTIGDRTNLKTAKLAKQIFLVKS
jgi:surface carbohydrate biosynthesis protein